MFKIKRDIDRQDLKIVDFYIVPVSTKSNQTAWRLKGWS